MTMLTVNGLFSGGGLIFRLGKAVSVSLVGLSFAFLVMFLLASMLVQVRGLLPNVSTAVLEDVAPIVGGGIAQESWARWFNSFIVFSTPLLVTILLLMRDARPWLRLFAAVLVIVAMANGLFHFVQSVLLSGEPVIALPVLTADAAIVAVLGSAGFAWIQVSFARIVLWSTGDRNA